MAHFVDKVVLKDSDGKVIDRGRHSSFGDTGTRKKFVFRKKGESYPKNITVEVHKNDGTVKSYKIPEPSKRYD